MEIFPNNMIMKNILSCKANQIIRTKTMRSHPFVFTGKELHKGK